MKTIRTLITLLTMHLAPVLHAADGSLLFSPAAQQRVEVTNFAGLGISNEVTVEFWALSTSAGISQSVFMLNPDTATNRFQSHLNYFNGNTYWDFGDIGNDGRVQVTNNAAWLNNWTHFALVASSAAGMKIYANGAQVASATGFNDLDFAALTTQAAKLSIGGILNTYFQGKIDDFRIWNIARSAADIQRDMTGPLTGSEAGLRLYFKFDEGSGITAVNSATATGTNFNGTLMGTNLATMWSAPARTTYTVTTTNDTGAGSLRQALTDAAADSGPALITFDAALSGQSISLTGPQNDSAIVINDAGGVTIDATNLPGGLTINRGIATDFRLFSIASGTSLTLRGLTLANGGGGEFAGNGGAIYNSGTLTLTHCALSGYSAQFSGGAIDNNGGTLTLTQCSLSGNSALYGGAIRGSGTLTQCTLTGNTSTGEGGAILGTGTVTLRHCTVSGNSAGGSFGGGGVYLPGQTLVLENSIVAGNTLTGGGTGPDIRLDGGTVNASGANLVQAAIAGSGTVNGSATITVANPRLAPLASNGGPTKTMALLPGSPAIDAATVIPGLTTDQRGLPRSRDGDATAGAAPDIGAYEAQVAPFSLGFNFVGGRSGVAGGTLNSGDIAGVPAVAQGNWNNLTTDFAGSHAGTYTNGPTPALASDGSAFSPNLRLWWDASSTYTTSGTAPAPATPPDQRLMFGYLDSNNSGDGRAATNLRTNATGQPYFAAAGLPAAVTLGGYRVLVYADGDAANPASPRKSEYWLTSFRQTDTSNVASEVPLTPSLFIGDTANFSGTYTRGTGTSAATATEGANYVQFDGLTEPGGFMVRAEEVGFRAPINAVQIVRNELLVVTTAADENDPIGTPGAGLSLREAVALAPDGAGIVFDPAVFNGEPADTITLSSEIVLAKSVTIDASSLPAGVTVSGNNSSRIFYVKSGKTVSLRNLPLTGGNGQGPINGTLGGAIYSVGTLTLTKCTLSSNSSNLGGAIYSSGTLTLTHCTLSGNSVTGDGGAIYNFGTLTLTHCTLSGNSATVEGGAIYNGGTLTLTHCTLSGNSASNAGGAINSSLGTLALTHCTFTANTALYGGAIVSNGGSSTLTHCTLALNQSTGANAFGHGGGAIDNYGNSTLTLTNCILAGNTSATANGPDLWMDTGALTATACLIGDGTSSTLTNGVNSNLVGTGAAPINALLAPLGNYGGPTQTMALLPTSPARNAATGSTITADQRGFPIVGTPDIGAYEAGTFTNYNAWAYETLPAAATAPQHASTADYDGDGQTNGDEWLALTDPASATSRFAAAPVRNGANLDITIPTATGRTYTLLQSDTLLGGSWTPPPGFTPTAGTGSPLTFQIPIAGERKFYEVQVSVP